MATGKDAGTTCATGPDLIFSFHGDPSLVVDINECWELPSLADAGWFDGESRRIDEVIHASVCQFNINASTALAHELQEHQQQAADLARYRGDRTKLQMDNSNSQRRAEAYSEEGATARKAGQVAEEGDELGTAATGIAT